MGQEEGTSFETCKIHGVQGFNKSQLDSKVKKIIISDTLNKAACNFLNMNEENVYSDHDAFSVEESSSMAAWDRSRINLLIEERLNMEREFSEGKKKKMVLWNALHRNVKMIDPHFPFLPADMKSKFYNLQTTYKRVKSRHKSTGQSRTNWPFFDMFDSVYGSKHSVKPPENNLCSSFFDKENSSDQANECFAPEKDTSTSTRKNKNDDLLEFLRKQSEKEEQRHQEFINIENRKLEVEIQKIEALREMQDIFKKFLHSQNL